jgi:Phycobilisome protein
MLVGSQLSQVPTVERLVTLWGDRYLPDLSILSIGNDPHVRNELRKASSPVGRTQTVGKLHKNLVEESCKLAAVRTKDLYNHLPDGFDIKEVIQLAHFASRVYFKLLEVYQTTPASVRPFKKELHPSIGDSSLEAWGIPKISQLADTLEPLLLEFQEQHLLSQDWRTLGFITTQINFSNALLIEQLTPVEQVLINPYFKFLEEQVALPWQRVCAAAAKHSLTSPAFVLVEQMLPKTSEISNAVYDRLRKSSFQSHQSRRGRLDNPAVKHSCLRDLSMFQAYLWLCVLQGNSNVVEQELVALCVMVLESVGIPWKMTARGNEFLIDEILSRLNASQKYLIGPYSEGMSKAFYHEHTHPYAQSI